MRIEFSKILAQSVRDRNPKDYTKPLPAPVTYGRSEKIAEVQQQAIEFTNDFLLDFDLPSAPILRVGRLKGFEDKDRAFIDIVGVIHVNADFKTLNNHRIRMDLAVPLVRGQLQKPSIVVYKDKKYVLSQEFIDDVIASYETVRPKITKQYGPFVDTMHTPTVNEGLFKAPNDPTQWSMLVTERY